MKPSQAVAAVLQAVAGLGPHGERPTAPEFVVLSPAGSERARSAGFTAALVLHTTGSDWSRRVTAGIEKILADTGGHLVDIVDCGYRADIQAAAVERLAAAERRPDAVIAIPVGGSTGSDPFRRLAASGTKLVLLDNVPPGLLPERDYASAVSCDNFGLGEIAAGLLSPHVPANGTVCVVAYKIDFFATAQREIAFERWMRRERPDVRLDHLKFAAPTEAGTVLGAYLDCGDRAGPDGLFVVWDEPAAAMLGVLEERPGQPAMTTVDLGKAVADALAADRIVKGVAAQRPFEQGAIADTVAIKALLGEPVPPWIVLSGLAVTAANVADAYHDVGGTPASPELMAR